MEPTPVVQALVNRGVSARDRRDYASAKKDLETALGEAKRLKDDIGRATALLYLGGLARTYDLDPVKARRYLTECLTICKRYRLTAGSAYAHAELGSVAYLERKTGDGRDQLSKAIELFDTIGDRRGRAQALHQLGLVEKQATDYEKAGALWEESLLVFDGMGDRHAVGQVLLSLGNLYAEHRKDDSRARGLYERAESLFVELGLPDEAAKARNNIQLLGK